MIRPLIKSLPLLMISTNAFAAGGLPNFINYYQMVVDGIGVDGKYMAVVSGVLVLVLLTVLGMFFKSSVEKSLDDPIPHKKFSFRVLVEMIMDFLYNLTKEQCGHKYRKFLPFLCTIFLFILVCNLTGMIPGFPPATENMSTNVAIGLFVFIVYNVAGLKENGSHYLKHFLGPVAFIAPLYLGIELFSHMSRPLSLGLRLLGNIFGDHLLLAVFSGLIPLVAPVALLFFGLLVAAIQSFVFTLLTGIYISMAISHD